MTANALLRDLRPDTEYKVTLVPVYADVEGKRSTENGKTSEFEAEGEELQNCRLLTRENFLFNFVLKCENLFETSLS